MFAVMILFFDWHIGLIAIIGIALYFAVVSAMEKKSVAIAEGTQRSQTALVEAVLENHSGHERGQGLQPDRKGRQKAPD